MNITDSTKEIIQELIHLSYVNNAKIDRMKSVLVADFAYNETSDVVHQCIAHYFSNNIGDALSENCMERYNISVVFGDIPVMNKEYKSVSEILNDLLELVVDYQNALIKTIDIVKQNMDFNIMVDLEDYLKQYNVIVDQCILLVDKINLYKDNPSFDAHLKEHFLLLGLK